jgi:hypothetical protein
MKSEYKSEVKTEIKVFDGELLQVLVDAGSWINGKTRNYRPNISFTGVSITPDTVNNKLRIGIEYHIDYEESE